MLVFISLLLFWFVVSGQFSTFFVVSALISVFIVVYLNKRLFAKSNYARTFSLASIFYVIKLLRDMFISSLKVSKIIWFDSDKVKPCCRLIDAESLDLKDQVIQANSITLTPGTMSLHLKDNKILVHAINAEMFEGNDK